MISSSEADVTRSSKADATPSTKMDTITSATEAVDETDSDDDNTYRLIENQPKSRKVGHKKRLDAAAFQAWVDQNQREISKPTPGTDEPRRPSTLGMFSDEKNIIESPREYQTDLFQRAKTKSIIVVLDTGKSDTHRCRDEG